MSNEIRNRYSDGNEEVFQFGQTSHNADEFINNFSEEVYRNRPMTIENRERLMRLKKLQEENPQMFSGGRQDTALRQIDRMASKSIGTARRTEQKYRKRNSNVIIARKRKEAISALCAIFLVAGLSFTGIKTIQKVDNFIESHINIEKGLNVLTERAYNDLCRHNLASVNEKGKYVIGENSVSDYRELGVTSHLDVYVFKQILSNTEFDKFIRAVSYNNGYNYYTDMYQFLNINGYYMSGTNTPSIDVFNNMMEGMINNMADKLLMVEDTTYIMEDEQPKSRGGI